MSIVILVSGGLDSTLVAKLAQEENLEIFPLFVNYGQISYAREFEACVTSMKKLALPPPKVANLSGYGKLIRSGLTDPSLRILEDAFTPGRNLLFLLTASAYAVQVGANAVSIGLLHEATTIFPDQTRKFLDEAERIIELTMGQKIRILTPLSEFFKRDVVALAENKGISGTYSCHFGKEQPCRKCIACKEFEF